jgi:hypothetical protein
MREIAHNWISSVRIKANASRIAAATASAAQSEDRSANQKTTFFDSIDPLQKSQLLTNVQVRLRRYKNLQSRRKTYCRRPQPFFSEPAFAAASKS